MLAIATQGDLMNGHGGCPTYITMSIEGSSNVFCEGKPAHRVGDKWANHFCQCGISPPHPPHPLKPDMKCITATGSGTVFINGKAAARDQDTLNCGGKIVSLCSTVFVEE